jgi:hypothetical protein
VTLTKTDRERVTVPPGVSHGARPRPPTSLRRGGAATEPTAPNGVKEHCLLPGAGLRPACRTRPSQRCYHNQHDSRQRISRLSHR